jgi:hypothetical protein
VRIKERKSFAFRNVWKVEVTKVREGGTEDEARAAPQRFEIEIELIRNTEYLESKKNAEVAVSLLSNCMNLVPPPVDGSTCRNLRCKTQPILFGVARNHKRAHKFINSKHQVELHAWCDDRWVTFKSATVHDQHSLSVLHSIPTHTKQAVLACQYDPFFSTWRLDSVTDAPRPSTALQVFRSLEGMVSDAMKQ